jgi:hypothetical protein
MPKVCEELSVHLCAACPELSSKGSKTIVAKICLRTISLLKVLYTIKSLLNLCHSEPGAKPGEEPAVQPALPATLSINSPA